MPCLNLLRHKYLCFSKLSFIFSVVFLIQSKTVYKTNIFKMLSIIQRVSCANVVIEQQKVADINKGILALVCVEKEDTHQNFEKMAEKILKYRIFEDEAGKMNLSLRDIQEEIILVPQFTLAANTRNGNRPSFSDGCPPNIAKGKFEEFQKIFKSKYEKVQLGIFGADMKVSLTNDGPVTFSFKI